MLTVVQTLCEAWWDLWGRILKGSYRKIVKRLMGAKEMPNLMQMKKVVCFWEGSWYHWLSKIMRLSYCELRRKWSESRSVMSDSLSPDGLYSSWNSPGQNTGVRSLSLLQGLFPSLGIEPRSPALQEDSLPAELQGKPKNTGLGSLTLLQRIFPTQESNQGLRHCRRILYQLSYQRSPNLEFKVPFKVGFLLLKHLRKKVIQSK